MNLSGVDLNLLVALDALLREQSVTRAAARVGLSQPAMSSALSRLRDLFDDPILRRVGHSMIPTSRAEALRAPLTQALALIEESLEGPGAFDPARCQRRFAISSLDSILVTLLPRIVRELSEVAPGVRVDMHPLRPYADLYRSLEMGELDFAISQFASAPRGIRQADFLEDRVVCMVRRAHPRIKRKPTLKQFLRESHLAIDAGMRTDQPFSLDRLLDEHGFQRKIAATLPTLALAPLVVSETDLICTALAKSMAGANNALGLRTFDAPIEFPAAKMQLVWHQRADESAAHRWFRELLMSLDLFG